MSDNPGERSPCVFQHNLLKHSLTLLLLITIALLFMAHLKDEAVDFGELMEGSVDDCMRRLLDLGDIDMYRFTDEWDHQLRAEIEREEVLPSASATVKAEKGVVTVNRQGRERCDRQGRESRDRQGRERRDTEAKKSAIQ
jgi:hypothetical protein